MNTISSSEIKRRGIGAVDELIENGPVHVIRNNTLDYVVLTEESYKMIIDDLISARLNASDMEIVNKEITLLDIGSHDEVY